MKRVKFQISTFILCSLIVLWISCKPDLFQKSVSPEIQARIESLGLDDHNKKLLVDFFNGELTDSKGIKAPEFSITLWHEMLRFKSKEDYKNYFKSLIILKDKWDYQDKLKSSDEKADLNIGLRNETDGYFETLENIGDDAQNAVEASMGFQSLRRYYDLLEYNNENWRNGLEYIADPQLQSVLSSNSNMMIAQEIYHFIDNGLVAMIQNQDLNALSSVQQNGLLATSYNLDFYDEFGGNIISGDPPPAGPTGTCKLDSKIIITRTADFRTIRLTRDLFDIGGATVDINCANTETKVNWGDGRETTISQFSTGQNHTYDFDPTMQTTGKDFTITVTIKTLTKCGSCEPGEIFTGTRLVKIKDPGEPCFKERNTNFKEKFFSPSLFVSGEYKMEAEHGQRGEIGPWWAFSPDEKVWVNVKFFKKNGNGKFKRFTPNINLEANSSGKIFVNDCQTESNLSISKVKKDDYVEAITFPLQTFGTRKSGTTEPLANGIARITSLGATRTIENIQIWE